MRNLLLIPVLCAVCAACSPQGNNAQPAAASSQETSADWQITTKVKASIVADTQLSASARLVSVETTNGVVTITGDVPTAADRDRIVEIARSINGVTGVNSQMNVTGE